MADILPGPSPRTVTRTTLVPRSKILVAIVIAVAWAAIFVPFLVFLNPSMPQLLIIWADPIPSVKLMMVLFLDDRMLTMGRSLNGTPWNNVVGVFSSGKMFFFLQNNKILVWFNVIFTHFLTSQKSIDRWKHFFRPQCRRLWLACSPSSPFGLRPSGISSSCGIRCRRLISMWIFDEKIIFSGSAFFLCFYFLTEQRRNWTTKFCL